MTLKKPISFSEQVQMLLSHGIAIKDERKVEQILESINYYRLTGYALQFRKDPDDSDCVEGTTFEQILQVYQFDTLANHLHCLSVLRNKCAHGADSIILRLIRRRISQSSFCKKIHQ